MTEAKPEELDNLRTRSLDEFEVLLVGGPRCEPCEKIKEMLKEEIDQGTLKYVDINSDEARSVMKDADEKLVPAAFAWDKETEEVNACQIFLSEEIIVLKCKDSVIALKEPESEAVKEPEEGEASQ